jgi:hypothetical protein
MEREMRMYGLNLPELFLEDFLTGLGWVVVLFAIAARVFGGFFQVESFSGGLVTGLTLAAGLVLLLASSGIRQNHASLDLGFGLYALTALAWLVHGLLAGSLPAGIAAVIMALLFWLALYLRRLAVQARFKPRFFSLRQFETVVQIADTLIDGDGQAVLHPIEVAINIDHFLAKFDSPTAEDIRSTLNIVEWGLPLITLGRPFPFSALGSHERRRAVEKVVAAESPLLRDVFKDIARFLKLLAFAGYYGSEEGMASVGYRPYEERPRSQGVDQTPLVHPDPFTQQGA